MEIDFRKFEKAWVICLSRQDSQKSFGSIPVEQIDQTNSTKCLLFLSTIQFYGGVWEQNDWWIIRGSHELLNGLEKVSLALLLSKVWIGFLFQ